MAAGRQARTRDPVQVVTPAPASTGRRAPGVRGRDDGERISVRAAERLQHAAGRQRRARGRQARGRRARQRGRRGQLAQVVLQPRRGPARRLRLRAAPWVG